MAQCVQSVQEFVQDSFVPMVAVLCSEEAERVTRKNNLNFAELLRPFCRLTSEGMNNYSKHTLGPVFSFVVGKNEEKLLRKIMRKDVLLLAGLRLSLAPR